MAGPGLVKLEKDLRVDLLLDEPMPSDNHVLEMSLGSGVEYRLTFLSKGKTVGSTRVQAVGPGLGPGMHPFFLRLEEHVHAERFDTVVVESLKSDGPGYLGHLFVYPDSCLRGETACRLPRMARDTPKR